MPRTAPMRDFQCCNNFEPCCQELHFVDSIMDDGYAYVGNTSMRNVVHLAIAMGASQTWFKRYQVSDYEPRRVGDWEVYKFSVDDIGAYLHNRENTDPGRWIVPGDYTGLLFHAGDPAYNENGAGQVIMSDTPTEIMDHMEFIDKAFGRVLINGLGLGMVAHALLQEDKRDCIEHIDIVEYNKDVIDLVAYYFKDEPKVTIHHDDAFTIQWPRGTRWDCAWHDIWYTVNPDDMKEHDTLIAKYKRKVSYQDAWMRRWYKGFLAWERRKAKKEAVNG